MIKQFSQLVDEQVKDTFSQYEIKNIQLNNVHLPNEILDATIQSFSHTKFINVKESCRASTKLNFLKKLNILTQLEGLHISFGCQTQIQAEVQIFCKSLLFLPYLRNFGFKYSDKNSDYQQLVQHLSEGILEIKNLEVLTLQFQWIENKQIKAIKSISKVFKSILKLTTINLEITVSKQREKQAENELVQLFSDISSLIQLKSLNIKFESSYIHNNKPTLASPFAFDISQLINLTVLSIRFSLINLYLHVDLNDLPNQISKLNNLEQLYIEIYHLPFSVSQINPLYDSAISLKQLKVLQIFIIVLLPRVKVEKEKILIGNDKIKSSNLKELILQLTLFGGKRKMQLINHIEVMTQLEDLTVNLQNVKLTQKNLVSLVNQIKVCQNLRFLKLYLGQRTYNQSFYKALGETFIQLPNLVEVLLDSKNKQAKSQEFFMAAIANITQLQELTIYCSRLFENSEQIENHNASFSKLSHLKSIKLSIRDTKSEMESLKLLSQIIPTISQIQKLNIDLHNRINLSYKDFGASLKFLQNLKFISLMIDSIEENCTVEQIDDLFFGFRFLSNLEFFQLFFRSNQANLEVIYNTIFESFCQLKKLKRIQLSYNTAEFSQLYRSRLIRKLAKLVKYQNNSY